MEFALEKILKKMISVNPSYSLRSFSKDIGINHSILSKTINGINSLSVGSKEKIQQSVIGLIKKYELNYDIVDIDYGVTRGGSVIYSESLSPNYPEFLVISLIDYDKGISLEELSKKTNLSQEGLELALTGLAEKSYIYKDDNNEYKSFHRSVEIKNEKAKRKLEKRIFLNHADKSLKESEDELNQGRNSCFHFMLDTENAEQAAAILKEALFKISNLSTKSKLENATLYSTVGSIQEV